MSLAFDKKNPKRLLAYVSSKKSLHSGIEAFRSGGNGQRIRSENPQQTICFSEVSAFQTKISSSQACCVSPLTTTNVDNQKVLQKLLGLNRHKESGPDGVSPYALNECASMAIKYNFFRDKYKRNGKSQTLMYLFRHLI